MEFSSKAIVLLLICLALAACNPSVEETAKTRGGEAGDPESTNGMNRKLPECAQRNKDGTYKYGHACSAEQWVEWQKKLDAMNAPAK